MLEFSYTPTASTNVPTMDQLKSRYQRLSTDSNMAQLGKRIRRARGKLAKSPAMAGDRLRYRQWQADVAHLFSMIQEPDVAQVSRITPMVQETAQACHDRIEARRLYVAKLRAMAKDRKDRRGKVTASDKPDNSAPIQTKRNGAPTTIV